MVKFLSYRRLAVWEWVKCLFDNRSGIEYNILNKTTGKDGHTPSDLGKLIDYFLCKLVLRAEKFTTNITKKFLKC